MTIPHPGAPSPQNVDARQRERSTMSTTPARSSKPGYPEHRAPARGSSRAARAASIPTERNGFGGSRRHDPQLDVLQHQSAAAPRRRGSSCSRRTAAVSQDDHDHRATRLVSQDTPTQHALTSRGPTLSTTVTGDDDAHREQPFRPAILRLYGDTSPTRPAASPHRQTMHRLVQLPAANFDDDRTITATRWSLR